MLGFRSHNVCEDSKFKVKGKFGEEERKDHKYWNKTINSTLLR